MSQITGPVFGIYGGQTNDGESQWRQAINQSLIKIDATISLSVLNNDQIVTPASPTSGDRYIVGSSATGSFSGHDKEIAVYTYSPSGVLQWVFYAPINGLKAYNISDSTTYIYDSSVSNWVAMPSVAGSFEIPNVGEFSGAYVTGQSGNFLIDSFDKTLYGACEYLIYVKRPSTSYKQVSKFIVTHDGSTTTQLVDYAKIYSDQSVPLATFSSDISGNNVRLLATALYSNLTVRVMKILINI
jgi:hypothetical protein